MQSGRPDEEVVIVDGGVVGQSMKVTRNCRPRRRLGGGSVWTGDACATGCPQRGGCAGSVFAGVLLA
jgi:hypothetical protein